MNKGVNKAQSNAQRVKVGDYGSQITITLENVEKDVPADVEWVRAYPTSKTEITQYINIPDYSMDDGTLYITLPEIPRGTYNLEIKDTAGRIYPAEGRLSLEMLQSTKEALEVYYVTFKDEIMDEVAPLVTEYLANNPDDFRGLPGEQGDPGEDAAPVPPRVYTRAEYEALETYDPHTLYIVKEADES